MNIIATTVPNFVLPDAERITARLLRKYYRLSPQWTSKQAGHIHTLSSNALLQSEHDHLRAGHIANTHRRHRGSWRPCAFKTASAGEHKEALPELHSNAVFTFLTTLYCRTRLIIIQQRVQVVMSSTCLRTVQQRIRRVNSNNALLPHSVIIGYRPPEEAHHAQHQQARSRW